MPALRAVRAGDRDMGDSLREQLLKAGLVTQRQARQADQQSKQQQFKQAKAPRHKGGGNAPPPGDGRATVPGTGPAPLPPNAEAQQALARKIARDMELNRRQQEKAAAKARAAAVRQLIETHRLPPLPDADDCFNFTVDGRIRRIAVTAALRARIVAGNLVIVSSGGHNALVTPDVAARIRERDPTAVVDLSAPTPASPADDDPYKDFVVPDDLTW